MREWAARFPVFTAPQLMWSPGGWPAGQYPIPVFHYLRPMHDITAMNSLSPGAGTGRAFRCPHPDRQP